ncbi:MAG TPA: hypothetical protein VGK29_14415 [Paludibaculum sp.]|jgi:hypothetical protein
MKRIVKAAGGVLETPVASLLLGCGLVALAGPLFSAVAPAWRMMSAVAALCLLALWWMPRKQDRTLREMRQMLACFREETMTRRSTMRFMFDEMLDDSESLRVQVVQARHRLQTSIHVTAGFLELLCDELKPLAHAPAEGYLEEARRAVAHSAGLAAELGRKGQVKDQNLEEREGSPNNSTVSVLNLL